MTLIGHISPNSACTNRYCSAYLATAGSGWLAPACRRDGSWRETGSRRRRYSPSRDRPDDSRSSPRRGRSGRAHAEPADSCRRSAPARRAGRRPGRRADESAAAAADDRHRPDKAAEDRASRDRRRKNSCLRNRAPHGSRRQQVLSQPSHDPMVELAAGRACLPPQIFASRYPRPRYSAISTVYVPICDATSAGFAARFAHANSGSSPDQKQPNPPRKFSCECAGRWCDLKFCSRGIPLYWPGMTGRRRRRKVATDR